jgi:hypothetical protein
LGQRISMCAGFRRASKRIEFGRCAHATRNGDAPCSRLVRGVSDEERQV